MPELTTSDAEPLATVFDPAAAKELVEAFDGFIKGLKNCPPKELILVNPPLVPEDVFDLTTARRRGYYAFPPTGLLYVAAIAKETCPDLKIKIVDLNFELLRKSQCDDFTYDFWKPELRETIAACEAPFVGVTYMFGTTKPNFVSVAEFIRENFPDIPIVTGGVQATYDATDVLESGLVDLVFRKEGELQLKLFLQSCLSGSATNVPYGSLFRHNGKVYDTGEGGASDIIDWDRDITPFYDLIEIKDYNLYGSLGAFSRFIGEDKTFATVLTNRGCRAQCTFCTVRDFNGRGVRQRSVRGAIDEVKHLVREKGIDYIDWLDDDLLWNEQRTLELLKGLAEEVPELEWTASNGLIAVAISEQIMEWMVKSGLRAFKIGIETGNEAMLKLVQKPTTKPKLREKRQLFKKYPEVLVSPNFIIGFPNETFGQMMDTFNFACELEWDWSSFFICVPLRGTAMFSSFQALGDDRCTEETYSKTLNPGRSSFKGELKQHGKEDGSAVVSGRKIFDLPYDEVPSKEQLQEIWFTFNFVANFVQNVNLTPQGHPAKVVKWIEAIHSGYPHDASMSAALVRGYKLLGNKERYDFYRNKFTEIVKDSPYWQSRVFDFPELLEMAEVELDIQAVSPVNDMRVSYSRDAIPEYIPDADRAVEKYVSGAGAAQNSVS